METHHIKVSKTARYHTLGRLDQTTKQVIFLFHGYGQSAASMIRSFSGLCEQKDTFLIAPEGLSRFYWQMSADKIVASWMTKDDRENEIKDYVSYLDSLYDKIVGNNPNNCRLMCLGFSQGVATCTRWIDRSSKPFDTVINYAGSPADEISWEKQNHRIGTLNHYFVFGNEDQWISENRSKEIISVYTDNQVKLKVIQFEGKHEIKREVVENLRSEICPLT